MHRALREILEYSDVIGRRQYPELVSRIDHAVRRGELVVLLPGVYCLPERSRDWRVRADAVSRWDPRAVLVGEVAAALTFWPELTPSTVDVACRRADLSRSGFRFTRREIPPGLVMWMAGIPVTVPALTALDLTPRHGGDAIDRALRSRTVSLSGLHEAFAATAHRRGNVDRRRLLLDSRDEPWSAAERLAHRLLREAGITRWHANVPIICDGVKYVQDIAMDDCPVVVEIDGKVHMSASTFEGDRRRGNLLLLAGKLVLHYTWSMLTEEPGWVISTVSRAIERYG